MSTSTIDDLLAAAATLPPGEQAELLQRLAEQVSPRRLGPVRPDQCNGLTYPIIGCAMRVHNRLGRSHSEAVYQDAMAEELPRAGLPCRARHRYAVYDDAGSGRLAGYYLPDLVVDGLVLVELKVLPSLDRACVSQMIAYLKASGCPVGLLLNFGEVRLGVRRILPPVNLDDYGIEPQWLVAPDALPPGHA